MHIPKKIHYCWFGRSELPKLALHCIASWKKYCPEYEIIRWDESNSDLESCLFVKEAYEKMQWAFVSDYIRLKIVEEHGGIYLDIDVELQKTLDYFLEFNCFMGIEKSKYHYINTGLGFGAVKHHPAIRLLILNYEQSHFIMEDASLDTTPCPIRDTKVLTKLGFVQENKKQEFFGVSIFPSEYFCPISILGRGKITDNTVSIHHFNGAWLSDKKKGNVNRKRKLIKYFGLRFGIVANYIYVGIDEFLESGFFGLFKRCYIFITKIVRHK